MHNHLGVLVFIVCPVPSHRTWPFGGSSSLRLIFVAFKTFIIISPGLSSPSPSSPRLPTMRAHWGSVCLLIPALAAVLDASLSVYASPFASSVDLSARGSTIDPREYLHDPSGLRMRDGGGHGHHNTHAAPLLQLNETEVTMHHAPTPPSYWSIDIDNVESDSSRHPGLMALHGILMSLAFFVALPMCESC